MNIYDNKGKRIGQTNTVSKNDVIYDHTGRRLGYYSSNTNSTYDNKGKRIGSGNQTTKLLK